ncbi:hypothetical protein ABKN59_002799 [Abortiporus biennis]
MLLPMLNIEGNGKLRGNRARDSCDGFPSASNDHIVQKEGIQPVKKSNLLQENDQEAAIEEAPSSSLAWVIWSMWMKWLRFGNRKDLNTLGCSYLCWREREKYLDSDAPMDMFCNGFNSQSVAFIQIISEERKLYDNVPVSQDIKSGFLFPQFVTSWTSSTGALPTPRTTLSGNIFKNHTPDLFRSDHPVKLDCAGVWTLQT